MPKTALSAPADLPAKRSPWEVQRAVFFALLLREMKARVGGQWVGAVWTFFEPLAHVLVVVIMLGVLRGRYTPEGDYTVYLVTGLLPYFLFRHLTMRLMEGVRANRGLFAYRQVRPLDPLLSRAAIEMLMNLIVYLVTLSVLGWAGYQAVPHNPLAVLAVHSLLAFLGISLGVLMAVIGHERPRLRSFVGVVMMPLYVASGVMFPLHVVPQPYLSWLMWNPLAHLIDLSRAAFFTLHVPLPGVSIAYPAVFALALATLALSLYRVERQKLATVVSV